ncbi:hypothetical protein GGQ80_000904 [Sphingomonas jinjuensis]|uniref:Uncharacterized protein n=1 Tax=Sphingomonas jinjuensis TaxID=535907 RepID=A0A840F9P7_9SPHN|nr:hypothetical protein [Sphingomonas jinjuensis]
MIDPETEEQSDGEAESGGGYGNHAPETEKLETEELEGE